LIRLERPLREQLETAARLSFRPLSNEIAFRLAASLKQIAEADRAA
jgi:hypothetical protein